MLEASRTRQARFARRNLWLHVFCKIFMKRVFLPLSAIYFVGVVGLSLAEIGVLAVTFSLTQFVVEVPTGYFADRVGRAWSIRLGAGLNIASTLLYVLMQNKTGVFAGTVIEALGYSFMAGASEALVHDSLVTLGKEKEYAKRLSRAQALALLINAAFMAAIPMLYPIDPRLPFLAGTGMYVLLFGVSFAMHDMQRVTVRLEQLRRPSFKGLLRKKHLVVFGALFGIVSALYTSHADFTNLALKEFGIAPQRLGWVFAVASLVGAALGWYVHALRRLRVVTYAALDGAFMALPFFAAFSRSWVLLAGAFVLQMSFWRYRRIIYQDHLLRMYPTRYKATLLSVLNNVEQVNLLWMPLVVSVLVTRFDLANGLGLVGVFGLVIVPFYLVSIRRHFRRRLAPQHGGVGASDLAGDGVAAGMAGHGHMED